MRLLGNIIWHIPFCGFVTAGLTYLFGLLLTISVVAAPIGLGLMEHGKFLFWPFGNAMVSKNDLDIEQNPIWKAYSFIITLIYIPFGLVLAFVALFQVIGSFVTIIGIPVALVIAKSLGTFLNPVNKICVSSTVRDDINRRRVMGNS